MKNTHHFFYLLLIIAFPFLQSCDRDDDSAPAGEFATGVIISDEGNFRRSNASVTYFNPSTENIRYRIFESTNNRPLGDVLQDIYFDEGTGYLVLNGSNKVEVVNANTFESTGVIEENLINPRYMTSTNGKGYITNWGPFDENYNLNESFVAVVDLATNTVTKKIATGAGTDQIGVFHNKIFAANNYGNSISVINTTDDEVIQTIDVASSPGQMVEDAEGNIWVICAGSYQQGDGFLYVIDATTEEKIKEIALGMNASTNLALNKEKNKIYYTSGKSVYAIDIAATTAPTTALFTNSELVGSVSAIGINPQDGNIYIGDARGFQGSGRVYIYSATGELQTNFSSGIGPNQFWFK